jgi:hypothetical protein
VVTKRKRHRKGNLHVIDVGGGRKATVGTTVSEALTSLVPAFFTLAIAGVALNIMTETLSKSGLLDSQSGLKTKENQ